MLQIKKLAEMLDKQVYTDEGNFFGKVEEVNIINNRIDGWRLVAKDSEIISALGGARGIIVPHQFIKAIGNIIIVSKNVIPIQKHETMPTDIDEDIL